MNKISNTSPCCSAPLTAKSVTSRPQDVTVSGVYWFCDSCGRRYKKVNIANRSIDNVLHWTTEMRRWRE